MYNGGIVLGWYMVKRQVNSSRIKYHLAPIKLRYPPKLDGKPKDSIIKGADCEIFLIDAHLTGHCLIPDIS